MVAGYGTALWRMSTSLDMLPIGVVWLYGETVNPTMRAGIAVITVGVTILATGRGQHRRPREVSEPAGDGQAHRRGLHRVEHPVDQPLGRLAGQA